MATDSLDSISQSGAAGTRIQLSPQLSYLLELALVVACAILAFSCQVFFLAPKLSLLFDSQGYLFVTQSCQQFFSPDNLHDAMCYFMGACQDDILRTAIVSHNPGILELVKSGPILPGILLCAFAILGETATTNHWSVGAAAMVALMSLGVCGIWMWARMLGGSAAARIAVVLAITYGGFVVNSGRILSEIPATAFSVFALLSVYLCARSVDANKSGKQLVWAFVSGCASGLLMLARPTLLPWPLLLAACLLLYCAVSRRFSIFRPSMVLTYVVACIICLTPWVMAKQVLTGVPSIVVERNGPLNLAAGMDLRTDGFDALPSPLVGHPEQFKQTTGEVIKQLVRQFRERPAACIHLLLRKPLRLLDSPWNDFQLKSLGLPFLLQRFMHQLILLAAVLGVVLMLEHGRKRPDYLLLLGGLLIGIFMSFHLVACAFISMSRYFITAMPAAIVAASYLIAHLARLGKRALPASIALCATPLVSMILYYLLVPGYARLSDISSDLGLAPMSLVAAFLMTAAFAAGMLVPAFTIYRGVRSKLLLSSIALVSGFFCFVTVCYQFMCSEAVIRLGSVDHECMVARAQIPSGTDCDRWYLVLDANDATAHGATPDKPGILPDMKVQLNGRDLKPDWLPLLSMDTSMREESMYLTAFAYSSGKRCSDFRQWMCAALPAETIVNPGENQVVLSLVDKQKTHPKIFADFADPVSKRIHTVSLRNFSWTKGFFADCPGEMRLDEWPDNNDRKYDLINLCGEASRLKPRAYLLGVHDTGTSEKWARQVSVPDQNIDRSGNLMAKFELPSIPGLQDSVVTGGDIQAIHVRVSGQLRSSGGQETQGSVCLLESFSQGNTNFEEYAPLAPQKLSATSDWQDFAFDEVIQPLRLQTSYGRLLKQPQKLQSLKLYFFGRPWWEALDYGSFKGKGSIEFRKLNIDLHGGPALNLSAQKAQWFDLDCQFKTAF